MTGTNGSGKGEAAEYFKKKGYAYFSLSDLIREELQKSGKELTRDNLIEKGNELRDTYGPDILAQLAKFQGIDNAPLTWLDIASSLGGDLPNQAIDIGDILAVIAGFQGEPYPGDGPLGCS